MSRALRLGALVLVLAVLAFGAHSAYRRSLPDPPAIVLRTADVHALLHLPLRTRIERAIRGRAFGRVAGPKLIALTFDDGPYPVDTPILLATLRAANVPATFFVIGRDAEQYPGLVRAIAAAGDEVANHTQTHPDLAALEPAGVAAELREDAATIGRLVPGAPEVGREFRPPHGRFTERTLRAAQAAGYDTILWTDDPGDWRNVTRNVLAAHILRFATRPEILLLHSGRPETVALLPDVIQRFRADGYTFLTVSELVRQAGADALNRAARVPLTATGT